MVSSEVYLYANLIQDQTHVYTHISQYKFKIERCTYHINLVIPMLCMWISTTISIISPHTHVWITKTPEVHLS